MYKIKEGIKIQRLGNQYVVKDEKKGKLYILNQLAGEILEKLKDNHEIQHIVTELCTAYKDVEKSTIANDINELMEEMCSLEVVCVY